MNLASIPNLTERVSQRTVNLAEGDPSNWVQDGRTGLIMPHYHVPQKRPIALDLFAGCGGFSLGIIQGGFDVVAACEWDDFATLTYLANLGAYPVDIHYMADGDKERLNRAIEKQIGLDNGQVNLETGKPLKGSSKDKSKPLQLRVSGWNRKAVVPDFAGVGHFYFGDVRKLTGERILQDLGIKRGDLDLVFGGPPCQGFSQAGKRDVMDPRNSLVFEFTRLVCELQPKAMCMENVPAMAHMKTPEGLNVVEAICIALSKGGYSTLNALRNALGVVKEERGARVAMRKETAPTAVPDDEPITAGQMSLF